MKESELRALGVCACCGRKLLEGATLPLFYRLTVERFAFDVAAARRQDGLASFLGSTRLAAVMGPDEEMASPLGPPTVLGVCESCVVDSIPLARLVALRP